MKYDVILGVSFFVLEDMVVDMAGRRLTKYFKDGSRTDMYFDALRGHTVASSEDVLVHAAQEMKVNDQGAVFVPIKVPDSCQAFMEDTTLYYEDQGINRKLVGVRGLVDAKAPMVLVHLGKQTGQRSHTIREGDVIGRVTTVSRKNEDQGTEEVWTQEEIRSDDKINLGKDLSQEQKEEVFGMLWNHHVALSKGEFDIGQAKVAPHRIELTSESPIWIKPRKFSEPINQEIERQCQELLALNLIEHSESPFSAAIVPVSKRDGGLRMCVDYRKLNDVTKTEKFPMPNLTDLVYRAGGVKFFTKLDVTKGYYHVPLEESSRKYTGFSTHQNHYQFRTLSFGLKNSGIAFQRCMQQILAQCCSTDIMCYIDNILITSGDFQEHLDLVGRVLQTLSSNGIKVKLSKCEFFQEEVHFLGHLLSRDGIRKDPAYVKAVRDYPKPKDVTELRRFLGMINFQRKFVKDCSTLAKPLTEVTGGPKRKALEWDESMEGAFEKLKKEIAKEVTLTFPDYGKDAGALRLFVDASGVGAGACLFQRQEGDNRAIAYGSMTFSDAERRYSTIERELTAVRWGVKLF